MNISMPEERRRLYQDRPDQDRPATSVIGIEYKRAWFFPLFMFLVLVTIPSANAAYTPNQSIQELSYQNQELSYQEKNDRKYKPPPHSAYKYKRLADARSNKEKKKERWDQLSPEQKKRIKKRREHFEKLPPEQKQRVKDARENFQKMTPQERKKLQEKWQKMSPEQRQQYKKERGK